MTSRLVAFTSLGQMVCLHASSDAAINAYVLRWTRGMWAIVCRLCWNEVRDPEPPRDLQLEHTKGLN